MSDSGSLTDSQIAILREQFILEGLEFLLHGIYTTLVIFALHSLCKQKVPLRARRVVIIATIIMFLASTSVVAETMAFYLARTLDLGMNPPDNTRITNGIALSENVLLRINYLISDGIVVWRAWAVWFQNVPIRILLCLCLFGSFVGASVDFSFSALYFAGHEEFIPVGPRTLTLTLPLLLTNLVATLLIACKVWEYRREIKGNLGLTKRTAVERILVLLTESGALYCLLWAFTLSVGVNVTNQNSMAYAICAGITPQLTAIYPIIIIILVAMGKSDLEATMTGPHLTHPIHFFTFTSLFVFLTQQLRDLQQLSRFRPGASMIPRANRRRVWLFIILSSLFVSLLYLFPQFHQADDFQPELYGKEPGHHGVAPDHQVQPSAIPTAIPFDNSKILQDNSQILPHTKPQTAVLNAPSTATTHSPPNPNLFPLKPPRLQLIALWSPTDSPPRYMPNFLASVAANPSIDLLLIKFDKYGENDADCEKIWAPGSISNIREHCLTVKEMWTLHREFLCERWRCSEEQTKAVMEKLLERAKSDRVNSHYRPFRPAVFKKFIHPDTKLWGWCDLDVMFGNFDRAFPWDVSDQFDVYVSGWHAMQELLLFMPGHLMVFRHSHVITDEFMRLPNLLNVDAFLAEPWINEASEESEYSHFLFAKSNLTFLRFDAMINSDYHLSSPGLGVYQTENEWKFDLTNSSDASHPQQIIDLRVPITEAMYRYANAENSKTSRPTFTDKGKEHIVELMVGGHADIEVWFPERYACHYHTDWFEAFWAGGRRLVYRREPQGPIVERLEPGVAFFIPPLHLPDTDLPSEENRPVIREMLYNHLQHEKYTDWWAHNGVPKAAFKMGEVVFMDKNHGAVLWDRNGVIKWNSMEATV
ncbi:hypothetical protein C8J56DRAFT_1043438 [Mycena floridula]|nr:hypothetical protein C8J56DRAFT_1043438 [Mycena floridula]